MTFEIALWATMVSIIVFILIKFVLSRSSYTAEIAELVAAVLALLTAAFILGFIR